MQRRRHEIFSGPVARRVRQAPVVYIHTQAYIYSFRSADRVCGGCLRNGRCPSLEGRWISLCRKQWTASFWCSMNSARDNAIVLLLQYW